MDFIMIITTDNYWVLIYLMTPKSYQTIQVIRNIWRTVSRDAVILLDLILVGSWPNYSKVCFMGICWMMECVTSGCFPHDLYVTNRIRARNNEWIAMLNYCFGHSYTKLIQSASPQKHLNPLRARFFRGNIKHIFIFYVIPPHWYDTSGWDLSSDKTRTYPFYIVNIIAADVIVKLR